MSASRLVSNSRAPGPNAVMFLKYVRQEPNIDPEGIVQIGPKGFLVPSESVGEITYLVDMEMRSCNCPQGQQRGPCKHKHIVSVAKNLPSFDVLPTSSPEMRRVFMFLGTGKNMNMNWFLPLQARAAPPNQSPVIAVLPPEHVISSTETVDDRGPVIPVSSDEVKVKLQSAMNNLH